jgi:hypothetical protein
MMASDQRRAILAPIPKEDHKEYATTGEIEPQPSLRGVFPRRLRADILLGI